MGNIMAMPFGLLYRVLHAFSVGEGHIVSQFCCSHSL